MFNIWKQNMLVYIIYDKIILPNEVKCTVILKIYLWIILVTIQNKQQYIFT